MIPLTKARLFLPEYKIYSCYLQIIFFITVVTNFPGTAIKLTCISISCPLPEPHLGIWCRACHLPVLLCQGLLEQKLHTAAAISAISHLGPFRLLGEYQPDLTVCCSSVFHSKQFLLKLKFYFEPRLQTFFLPKMALVYESALDNNTIINCYVFFH